MYKAVIFDLDGVLVDSQPFHFVVDQAVLAKNGVFVPLEVVHGYAGMANQNRFVKYKNDFSITTSVEELIQTHIETIAELLDKSDLSVVDGIPELLSMLKQKGFKISVASSSSYDFIYKMLDKLGIRDYFDPVISGEDMKNSKPAPDIFLHAARVQGCEPSECIVIEDSAVGVAAAVAAGIKCIGYQNPTSGEQDLSGADMIIDDFSVLTENSDWLS